MKKVWTRVGAISASSVLLFGGCKSDPPRRSPPPEVTAAKPGACADSSAAQRDPVARALLPPRSGALCLDPQGGDRAYGEDADRPLERACDELLDGECEVYRSFGAVRVLEARYVDDGGSPATLVVHLSKFATAEGAYAMFTSRVVGDGDPASDVTPRALSTVFASAIGVNNAYVTRGPYLAEIVFTDEAAGSVEALRAAASPYIERIARDIGDKLPGDPAPPPAVLALPTASRVPLGVRFFTKDVLGIAGVGPGAVGYYREGERRYRVIALLRPDADQAKDLVATFAARPSAAREKAPHEGLVRFVLQAPGDIPSEWILGRARGVVLGVGDEVRVLSRTMTADERSKLSLSPDEKKKKLSEILSAALSR